MNRFIHKSAARFALTFLATAIAALGGCTSNPQTTASNRDAFNESRYTQPIHGMVSPSPSMSDLAAGRPMLSNRDWEYRRNDDALHLRPAVQPRTLQWVDFWQDERLRITNGRPYENTTVHTRTRQLSPRR